MKQLSRRTIAIFILTTLLVPNVLAAGAADVDVAGDVVYGKAGGVELKLNLARPKSPTGPLPCVVFIHGGGWVEGRKEDHDAQIIETAKHGYVAVTVDYRLVDVAKWPAQINDVKCAVRFLRAKAKTYDIDPDRIGAIGFSAGAHLAMMLAVTEKSDGLEGDGGYPDQSSRIRAAVSYAGPTDLARDDIPPLVRPIVKNLVGRMPAKGDAACRSASPVYFVSDGDAPMLLFQGLSDLVVPYSQACFMADALAAHNVPGRVELIAQTGHGLSADEWQRTRLASAAFFEEWMAPIPKKPVPPEQ
jgi:acetyl esterase/lipase